MPTKEDFKQALNATKNILLTNDSNTEFVLSNPENDPQAEMKNGLKSSRIYFLLLIVWIFIFFMVDVALLLMNGGEVPSFLMIVNFIGVAVGALIILKWSKTVKNSTDSYYTEIVMKAVQELLPDAGFEEKKYINPRKLYEYGVIPAYTDASGSCLIHFSKNGNSCYFSNLSLDYEIMDAERTNGSKVNTVFTGQAYVLPYHTNLQGSVRVTAISNDGLFGKTNLNGYRKLDKEHEQKIYIEDQEFNKNFEVYAEYDKDAFAVLTPSVIEKLLNLKQQYGNFGLALSNHELVIAFNTGHQLFAAPLNYQEIDKISIDTSKQQLNEMLQFAWYIENAINNI